MHSSRPHAKQMHQPTKRPTAHPPTSALFLSRLRELRQRWKGIALRHDAFSHSLDAMQGDNLPTKRIFAGSLSIVAARALAASPPTFSLTALP